MVMSDSSSRLSFQDLPSNIKVIAVMVGESECVDNMKPLVSNEEDILLYHEDSNKMSVCQRLCQCKEEVWFD